MMMTRPYRYIVQGPPRSGALNDVELARRQRPPTLWALHFKRKRERTVVCAWPHPNGAGGLALLNLSVCAGLVSCQANDDWDGKGSESGTV